MILFHFTSTHHLPQILRDGFIRPTESNVGTPANAPEHLPPVGEHVGPDVVWLLDTDEVTYQRRGTDDRPNRLMSVNIVRFTLAVAVQAQITLTATLEERGLLEKQP